MEIHRTTLEKLMHMAGLELTAQDQVSMQEDLNHMVAWVQKLAEVDTTGTEPLVTMSFEKNRLREDISEKALAYQKALANAPGASSNYFQVPLAVQ